MNKKRCPIHNTEVFQSRETRTSWLCPKCKSEGKDGIYHYTEVENKKCPVTNITNEKMYLVMEGCNQYGDYVIMEFSKDEFKEKVLDVKKKLSIDYSTVYCIELNCNKLNYKIYDTDKTNIDLHNFQGSQLGQREFDYYNLNEVDKHYFTNFKIKFYGAENWIILIDQEDNEFRYRF